MLQARPASALTTSSRLGKVSEAEWNARVELAACYRLAALHGWTDLIWTHISATVPGSDHHLLLNPFGLGFDEVTASNLVKIDLAGNIIDGDFEINQAGYLIHGAIHEARPDTACVIHVHTEAGMALSMLDCGLLPLSQHAMRFSGRVAYHDYEGIVLDADEKARLVANLGDRRAMILRNHGFLTVGRTVGEAFVLMYYMEKAARAQLAAMAACAGGGAALNQVNQGVDERTASQFGDDVRPAGIAEWPALLRQLDRLDAGYRQ